MKGDFTRDTFQPEKHYQQVLMQQGRVQLDADWNEQAAIAAHRDESTTRDLIGDCGGPADRAAFGITPDAANPGDFLLSAGRYYEDGIQCVLEQPVRFTRQPNLPGAAPLGTGQYLVYLDVWERHVTALEDPALREPALGGPDTATRVKTIWQVRVAPTTAFDPNLPPPDPCHQPASDFDQLARPTLPLLAADTDIADADTDPCLVPASAGYRGLENQLYRVEIHDGGAALAPSDPGDGHTVTSLQGNALTVPGLSRAVGEPIEIFAVESDAGSTRVNARAVAWVMGVSGSTFSLNTEPGLQGTLRARAIGATGKWSRDNGAIAFGVKRLKPGALDHLELASRPPDDYRALSAGTWIEILNEEIELQGLPGQMVQVANPDVNGFVALSAPLDAQLFPGGNLGTTPKLRRWDDVLGIAQGLVTRTWLPLERGVLVAFDAAADLRTGDYWQIPARAASPDAESGKIEWPRSNGSPAFLEPKSVHHHYCRLGVVSVDGNGTVVVISDCRCLWPPLTAVPRLFYVSGDGQEVMPDPTMPADSVFRLPNPLVVGVANGQCLDSTHPLQVRFVLTLGAGSVGPAGAAPLGSEVIVPIGPDSLARCDFHLDQTTANQQVTARLLGAPGQEVSLPIIFNANLSVASQVAYQPAGCTGLAGQRTVQDAIARLASMISIYKVSGDGQQAAAGARVRDPLRVRVANRCGPAAGVTVSFQSVLGRGEVTPNAPATDANGEVTCEWQLGHGSVLQVVEAEVIGDTARPATDPRRVHFIAHLLGGDSNDPAPMRVVGLRFGEQVLVNGQSLTLRDLEGGLFVLCDQPLQRDSVLDPTDRTTDLFVRGQPVCFVSVEVPYPLTQAERSMWDLGEIAGYRPMILLARVGAEAIPDGQSPPGPPLPDGLQARGMIAWQGSRETFTFLSRLLALLGNIMPRPDKVLARFTLKGNFIWSDAAQKLFDQGTPGGFLDGESWRAPRQIGESELLLPSGDQRRGGDFESWFWLVTSLPPIITRPPLDLTVTVGQNATFNVEFQSSSAVTFQWQRNGAAIAGATDSSFTVTTAQLADNGSRYRVVVANEAGPVMSPEATLSVVPPIKVTDKPADKVTDKVTDKTLDKPKDAEVKATDKALEGLAGQPTVETGTPRRKPAPRRAATKRKRPSGRAFIKPEERPPTAPKPKPRKR